MAPAFAPTLSFALDSFARVRASKASSMFEAEKEFSASSNPPCDGAAPPEFLLPNADAAGGAFLPALGAGLGFLSGVASSSSFLSFSSSAFLAAAAAALSALSSAFERPWNDSMSGQCDSRMNSTAWRGKLTLPPCSHLADSAASAFAFSAAFLLFAFSSLRARPAAALEFAASVGGDMGGCYLSMW